MRRFFRASEDEQGRERALEWLLRLRREGKLQVPYRLGVVRLKGGQPFLYAEDDLKVKPGELGQENPNQ